MPKKSVEMEVEPKVLDWAIESSGWKKEELIKKLKINSKNLDGWLSGTLNPKISQLEKLALIIQRPFAIFFLSEPQREKPAPKDYRMLPEREGEFDKKTLLAIRRARRLQHVSKDLSQNLQAGVKANITNFELKDNPKVVADKYRAELSISDNNKQWKTPYDLFNYLRDKIEDKNILIFQIPMPIDDARGFTLTDEFPAIIVVNSKDKIEARVFSLMHEFGHILLNKSGISIPENALFVHRIDSVEKWCNDFASSFLLPEEKAKTIFNENRNVLTETRTLNTLSRKLKLSKAMILYNMSKLNFISKAQYDAVLNRYRPEILSAEETKTKRVGFAARTADKRCIDERGHRFVSLVASNVEKGYITHNDALDYLSIKTKNWNKVTKKAKK